MLKNKLLIFIAFMVILQVVVSLVGLGSDLNVGVNPETGNFSVWNTPNDNTIQKQILTEFQPDQYLADNGGEGKVLGSTSLYNLYAKFSSAPLGMGKLLFMLLVVDLLLLIGAILVVKTSGFIPGKWQLIWEGIYEFFEDLVVDSLGKERINFLPYIATIFLFILTCNILGVIPGLSEPTRNLNVPLGMGIIANVVVHFMMIKVKGAWGYVKGYAEPMFFLTPLNVIGEASKVVSISFRLFGNILGGSIICVVISNLTKFIVFPMFLSGFFGIFIGIIQAFVFTMLSLSYLSAGIVED